MKHLLAVMFMAVLLTARADDAQRLIGTKAKEWQVSHWINSAPLTLEQLRGNVVLVRWWTAPQCPYCRATAPALNEFHEKYNAAGLEVIGFYHHKSDSSLDVTSVEKHTQHWGFKFPVAIDDDWKTLEQWWLHNDPKKWTSVSFLIDRHGVVRHVHPGGEYVKDDPSYRVLKEKIEELLDEK